MYCQLYKHPLGGESEVEAGVSVPFLYNQLCRLMEQNILVTFNLWAFGVLCTDIGITATMAYGLNVNKTGWRNLDKTLSTLIWYDSLLLPLKIVRSRSMLMSR
jgi:hypothetical protein